MKKVLLAFAICFSSVGFAQIIDVTSINEVNIPTSVNTGYSTMSPNGDYLLVTDFGRNGLHKYDLTSGKISTITSAQGAGYDVKILEDGNTVIYRETSFTKDHLKKTALKSATLSDGAVATIVEATRDLQGVATKNGAIYAVKNGKLSTKSFSGRKVISTPVMSIKNGQLMITKGSKTRTFSPNGNEVRYIWPSVSPDGTRVLYYVTGVGAFVCNIDGSNITSLGIVRAPKWYNSETIIGMEDVNGEYDTVKSSIIAVSIDGNIRQTLTDSSVIAMYPTASAQGDKISFTTVDGKAYIININVKK
ncbi:MAG: hypothetical protein RSA66_09055 [Muribaculaceae bacterium]